MSEARRVDVRAFESAIVSLVAVGFPFACTMLSPTARLVAGILLVVIAATSARFDPLHPLAWLPAAQFVYLYTVIIADRAGLYELQAPDELLRHVELAMASSVFVLAWVRHRHWKPLDMRALPSTQGLSFTLMVLLVCSIALSLRVAQSGATTKAEIALQGGSLVGTINQWALVPFVLLILRGGGRAVAMIRLGVMLVWATLMMLLLGERDILLAVILLSTLAAFGHGKLRKAHVVAVALCGILAVPVLARFKGSALGGGSPAPSAQFDVAELVSGEFLSAGRNLDMLLAHPLSWRQQHGATVLAAAGRALYVPAELSGTTAQVWFNSEFFPDVVAAGRGRGFGLVAEAAMNFGLSGVAVLMAALAAIASVMYRRAADAGAGWRAAYLLLVPLLIYAQRADLANIMTPLLRQIAIPIAAIYAANSILTWHSRQQSAARVVHA